MTVPGERNPEHLEIIEALKHLPDVIEEEIQGVSSSVMRARPADGGWSINETVGHLRDYAELTYKWVSMVCSLTDPMLPGLSADEERESVTAHVYQDADPRALATQIRGLRLQSVDILSHSVDWTRLGQLPRVGRRSLKQLAQVAWDHEARHLARIRALKAQQGAAA
jgi:hypothetical protein